LIEITLYVNVLLLLEEIFEHELHVFEASGVDGFKVGPVVLRMRFGLVVDAHPDQPEHQFADLDHQRVLRRFLFFGVLVRVVRDLVQLCKFVAQRPIYDVDFLLVRLQSIVVNQFQVLELIDK
jgi:hypothetical protein